MGEFSPNSEIEDAAKKFEEEQQKEREEANTEEQDSNITRETLDSRNVGLPGINDKKAASSRKEQLIVDDVNEKTVEGLFKNEEEREKEMNKDQENTSQDTSEEKEKKSLKDLRKFIFEKRNMVKIIEASSIDEKASIPMDGQHFIILESRAEEFIKELKQKFDYDDQEFPLNEEKKLGIACDNKEPWPKLIFIYAKEEDFEK